MLKDLLDRVVGKIPAGTKRSPYWRKVRQAYLSVHPQCEICNGTKNLTVHHIIPFHMAPDLELDPGNLITLCESSRFKRLSCHQIFGHFGDWRNWNPNVVEDARVWKRRLE